MRSATRAKRPPSAVVGGSLAQRPFYGGHSWVLLQYLLGFRQMGWEVLFLDRLDPEMSFDAEGRPCPAESSVNWSYLRRVMEGAGLDRSFALVADHGGTWLGVDRGEALRRVRESCLFLNVMGFVDDPEVLAAAPAKAFLDIDPGFGQMWKELGLADVFGCHDAYLTVGGNVGKPACGVPPAGLDWIPTRPPVVLEHWPLVGGGTDEFTTIGSWRGPFAPVRYRNRRYGLRVHEFRKFVDLPRRSTERFRLSIDIDPADRRDADLLQSTGWRLEEPRRTSGDPWRYRRYIQSSKAEFLVAKGMYVDTCSGWISDRSVCFLASGKPVLAQDTGLAPAYPVGEGLVTFRNLDEASEGANRIGADYGGHARRARELAEEYFDSRKVLGEVVDRLGVH